MGSVERDWHKEAQRECEEKIRCKQSNKINTALNSCSARLALLEPKVRAHYM